MGIKSTKEFCIKLKLTEVNLTTFLKQTNDNKLSALTIFLLAHPLFKTSNLSVKEKVI